MIYIILFFHDFHVFVINEYGHEVFGAYTVPLIVLTDLLCDMTHVRGRVIWLIKRRKSGTKMRQDKIRKFYTLGELRHHLGAAVLWVEAAFACPRQHLIQYRLCVGRFMNQSISIMDHISQKFWCVIIASDDDLGFDVHLLNVFIWDDGFIIDMYGLVRWIGLEYLMPKVLRDIIAIELVNVQLMLMYGLLNDKRITRTAVR